MYYYTTFHIRLTFCEGLTQRVKRGLTLFTSRTKGLSSACPMECSSCLCLQHSFWKCTTQGCESPQSEWKVDEYFEVFLLDRRILTWDLRGTTPPLVEILRLFVISRITAMHILLAAFNFEDESHWSFISCAPFYGYIIKVVLIQDFLHWVDVKALLFSPSCYLNLLVPLLHSACVFCFAFGNDVQVSNWVFSDTTQVWGHQSTEGHKYKRPCVNWILAVMWGLVLQFMVDLIHCHCDVREMGSYCCLWRHWDTPKEIHSWQFQRKEHQCQKEKHYTVKCWRLIYLVYFWVVQQYGISNSWPEFILHLSRDAKIIKFWT